MIISGEVTIEALREAVFGRLQDARLIVNLVESVRDLQEIDATRYAAIFETKVAYLRFKVAVEVTRIERPNEIAAKIEGSPLGVAGRLSATTVTTLSEVADGTQVNYSVDAAITGKLGSIGQPVLHSKAKEMENQFARNLRPVFEHAAEGALS
jgi:carbon monoxide dehydrogenase subunit G